MFDNLKAFIRHGRQAHAPNTPALSEESVDIFPELLEKLDLEGEMPRSDTYYAQKIVDEEKHDEPGHELVGYTVHEKIGEGAFSEVFRATAPNGHAVAVKALKKLQMDAAQKLAVLKEVQIMRQCVHRNIVPLLDYIETPDYYYIIQRLLAGGEVFGAIVEYTYFSEDLARHVIRQVAEAVLYLHEEVGIVHRDIKPENLLFDPIDFVPSLNPVAKLRRLDDPNTKKDEGEFIPGVGGGTIGVVRLADFGLSKQIWEHNTKTPCGTVGYTAPEIVRDERYLKEVDMWALGCVLYTLLCGFPPFYDERIETLTEKVARGEYTFLAPWWDEISSGAKNCVLRLLCVDKLRRYTIKQLLNDPWMLAGSAPRLPQKNRVQPKMRRYSTALYLPAANAMREAFDISTAVHRMGEEQALRVPEVVREEAEPQNCAFELDLGGASILGRRKKVLVET